MECFYTRPELSQVSQGACIQCTTVVWKTHVGTQLCVFTWEKGVALEIGCSAIQILPKSMWKLVISEVAELVVETYKMFGKTIVSSCIS